MTGLLGFASIVLAVVIAIALGQPMVGGLLISSIMATMILSRSLGRLPWLVLTAKLALLVLVSLLSPKLWPHEGGLIPVNPDQR